jgi:Flp pilus assembly protein TadG
MRKLRTKAPASAPLVPRPAPVTSRFAATRFGADASAATAVEFAILIPVFAALIYAIAQIGLYFYFSASLYNVTETATRQILVGSVANQGLTAAQYRTQILCPLLPSEMSCDNVITNIQVAPSQASGGFYSLTNYTPNSQSPLGYTMTGLVQPPMDNNKTSYCIGAGGSVVAVQVYYAMPVLGLSWMLSGATQWNGQDVVFIGATSVFMNEPFNTSYSGC